MMKDRSKNEKPHFGNMIPAFAGTLSRNQPSIGLCASKIIHRPLLYLDGTKKIPPEGRQAYIADRTMSALDC
jgi:hypothetical protein